MKICPSCKEEKSWDQYSKSSSNKTGFAYRCKACCSKSARSTYMKEYGDKVRERNRERLSENREYVAQYKLGRSCISCNELTSVCLDFHHVDPSSKLFGIAHSGCRTIEQLQKEIDKCVLLCANCHRKLHAGLIYIQNSYEASGEADPLSTG